MISESYSSKAGVAGISCAIAGAILNPLDVVKIRMQNNSPAYPWPETRFSRGIIRLIEVEGVSGLCKGLYATIMRELMYSTIRMGAYEPILHALNINGDQKYPSPIVKYGSSLLSGAIGAALANPTDLVKVNFQAALPGTPLPYNTTMGGFSYIVKTHGVLGLWKGSLPTIARAAVVTSAQLGSYDTIKNNILKRHFCMEDGIVLHFTCSLLAGIITTTASNPVDVVKTRFMSDAAGSYGTPLRCAIMTYKEGGIRAFLKGWLPSYFRIGPHTMISFLLMEQGRKLLGLSSI